MKKGIDYIAVGCWGVVTNQNEEVLLIKRKAGLWERPGGNVEVGELLEECIVREVREETGVETSVVKFLYYIEQLSYGSDKQHWLEFCYSLDYVSGDFKNNEPEKHEDVQWFKLTELPEKMSSNTKFAIDKYLLMKN